MDFTPSKAVKPLGHEWLLGVEELQMRKFTHPYVAIFIYITNDKWERIMT